MKKLIPFLIDNRRFVSFTEIESLTGVNKEDALLIIHKANNRYNGVIQIKIKKHSVYLELNSQYFKE